MADWRIEAYRLDTGEIPAQTFLDSLESEPRADALALLKLLHQYGNAVRLPHSRALGDGLFELRGFQVRLFYVFRGVRTVVLLDGMMKKRDDIPDDMVKRLRRMQRVLRARK
jgi:phage-related protein